MIKTCESLVGWHQTSTLGKILSWLSNITVTKCQLHLYSSCLIQDSSTFPNVIICPTLSLLRETLDYFISEIWLREKLQSSSLWPFSFLLQCQCILRKMCLLVPLLLFISPVCGDLLNFKPYSGSYMTTWTKAQTFCRKYHTDLITIRNEQENTFFKSGGWIGLYRANTNTWKWSRGDEIASFIKWGSSRK